MVVGGKKTQEKKTYKCPFHPGCSDTSHAVVAFYGPASLGACLSCFILSHK